MRLKISLFMVVLFLGQWASGQSSLPAPAEPSSAGAGRHYLHIEVTEGGAELPRQFSYAPQQQGRDAARLELKRFLHALHEEGYLLAEVLAVRAGEDSTKAVVNIGGQFGWARLGAGNVEPLWLQQTSWRQKSYRDKPFRYGEVSRLMQQLLRQAENSGYPFAAIKLDSIRFDSLQLDAELQLAKGPYIKFDTLVLRGNAPLSVSFLSSHLGIKAGEPFRQDYVDAVAGRLRALPYIKLLKDPSLTFQNEQATLYLELADKRANVLDGIVGLMPHPQHAGRMLLTGQLDLLLQNPFRTGKRIELHWQRLSEQSQNLETAYYHPYLWRSPLSLALGFRLLKEEERFVNREFLLEADLRQGIYNTVRLLLQQKDARLLSGAEGAHYASFRLEQLGLGFSRQRLDDAVFPRDGHELSFSFTGGQKKIRSLAEGADLLTAAVPEKSMQYRAMARFAYFRPLSERMVWAHVLEGAGVADKSLFLNDMFRLGGLSSLRGFPEKSFFVSHYALSRLELRYLAGGDSYLFLFYDQALTRQSFINLHQNDWPMGIGSGLSLGTNAGIFNFVYGLGKSENQALSFVYSQVHFGYVNRF